MIVSNRNVLGPADIAGTIDALEGVSFLSTTNEIEDLSGLDPEKYLIGDALLAPLGDYGGGTPTMPPLPGSSLIDAGIMLATTPANDQRGMLRPAGPRPDIGAVETFDFLSANLADSDHDGIPDLLEPAYGHMVGSDDSQADMDGDG